MAYAMKELYSKGAGGSRKINAKAKKSSPIKKLERLILLPRKKERQSNGEGPI